MTHRRKPVIYIAGPYRSASTVVPGQQDAWGIHQNVTNAMAWALMVWRAGGVALCPHGNTFCFQNAAPDHVWLEGDLELLRRCDAVLLIPGWSQSAGATAERDFAVAQQLPVFEWRDLSHLIAFIAEWKPR